MSEIFLSHFSRITNPKGPTPREVYETPISLNKNWLTALHFYDISKLKVILFYLLFLREAIWRVLTATGDSPMTAAPLRSGRKKPPKDVTRILGDRPNLQFTQSFINLTISTASLTLVVTNTGQVNEYSLYIWIVFVLLTMLLVRVYFVKPRLCEFYTCIFQTTKLIYVCDANQLF